MYNLNTHNNTASLYKDFSPEEARRIVKKLEIHYTHKYDNLLDIAETEINIMRREYLKIRITDIETLRAYIKDRNAHFNSYPTETNRHFSNDTSEVEA